MRAWAPGAIAPPCLPCPPSHLVAPTAHPGAALRLEASLRRVLPSVATPESSACRQVAQEGRIVDGVTRPCSVAHLCIVQALACQPSPGSGIPPCRTLANMWAEIGHGPSKCASFGTDPACHAVYHILGHPWRRSDDAWGRWRSGVATTIAVHVCVCVPRLHRQRAVRRGQISGAQPVLKFALFYYDAQRCTCAGSDLPRRHWQQSLAPV